MRCVCGLRQKIKIVFGWSSTAAQTNLICHSIPHPGTHVPSSSSECTRNTKTTFIARQPKLQVPMLGYPRKFVRTRHCHFLRAHANRGSRALYVRPDAVISIRRATSLQVLVIVNYQVIQNGIDFRGSRCVRSKWGVMHLSRDRDNTDTLY